MKPRPRRLLGPINDTKLAALKPGETIHHGDYNLSAAKRGNSTSFFFKWGAAKDTLTLGAASTLTLDRAIADARHLLTRWKVDGVDPRTELSRLRRANDTAGKMFRDTFAEWFEQQKRRQVGGSIRGIESMMRLHILPGIGDFPMNKKDGKPEVVKVLASMQHFCESRAHNAGSLMKSVFDYATIIGHRDEGYANPAGDYYLLMQRALLVFKPDGELSFLPPEDCPKFYADLVALDVPPARRSKRSESQPLAAMCLRLMLLTGCGARPSNYYRARFEQFDHDKSLWTIAGMDRKVRLKKILPKHKLPDFTVPMTDRVHDLIDEIEQWQVERSLILPLSDGEKRTGYLFPDLGKQGVVPLPHQRRVNQRAEGFIDACCLRSLMVAMGRARWKTDGCKHWEGDFDIHGLRKSFSTWAHGQIEHRAIAVERALDHVGSRSAPTDKTEEVEASTNRIARKYNKNDYLDERGNLLLDWQRFLTEPKRDAAVVDLARWRAERRA